MKETVSYTAHVQKGVLLNANERSLPMPEEIKQEVLEELGKLALERYPDPEETELLEAYGRMMDIDPACLLAGSGSDQMLGYMIGTFLGKGKVLYTLDPDFSMYDYYASGYEAEVKKYPVSLEEENDPKKFAESAKENNAGLIMFSNPNNPSGIVLHTDEIKVMLETCPEIPVVVDEAYMEFSEAESSISLINDYSNLYVTRTLSKAYGLAGARVGFLVSNEENMKPLKKNFVPYALNMLSMKTAVVVMRHHSYFLECIEKTKSERERVYSALKELKCLQVYPSQGNFVYGKSLHKEQILKALNDQNIVIRDYAGKDSFRITIGTEEENDAVIAVLQSVEESV